MIQKSEILIVDDRPENLTALSRTLAETDAEVVKAGSGNEALAVCLQHDFALALLDIRMPGMDGYELASLLRGDPKTARLPIVFLTATYADSRQVFRGYEAGAVDYIVKPYDPRVLLGKVKIFLDLDWQRRALIHHREELTAVNKELEAFAYSVSHDLRAPLRAIEGFSQVLLEECPGKLNEQERDYLHRVSSEAQRMARLIDDLLALSRVTRAEMRLDTVNIGYLANEIAARLREGDPSRRVELLIADDLIATGDPRLLGQALENLLSNAWKFTGHNENACIELGLTEAEGRRAFFVRDNGVGFDMKYANKLFTPFQRLHGVTEFPGTGVGLSTVQRIVSRHGGRVWCESRVGQGTTFYFTLGGRGAMNDIGQPLYEPQRPETP